eukprot:GHUV01033869.1.p1 GENE.GHUV01033869.1~~GHUV01033869.1.p1  ORF type:complete len:128 (+),score=11.32 GHUV01033869.1:82-465(+)
MDYYYTACNSSNTDTLRYRALRTVLAHALSTRSIHAYTTRSWTPGSQYDRYNRDDLVATIDLHDSVHLSSLFIPGDARHNLHNNPTPCCHSGLALIINGLSTQQVVLGLATGLIHPLCNSHVKTAAP